MELLAAQGSGIERRAINGERGRGAAAALGVRRPGRHLRCVPRRTPGNRVLPQRRRHPRQPESVD